MDVTIASQALIQSALFAFSSVFIAAVFSEVLAGFVDDWGWSLR